MWLPSTRFFVTDHARQRWVERVGKDQQDFWIALLGSECVIKGSKDAKLYRQIMQKARKSLTEGTVIAFNFHYDVCFLLNPKDIGEFEVVTVLLISKFDEHHKAYLERENRRKQVLKMKGSNTALIKLFHRQKSQQIQK